MFEKAIFLKRTLACITALLILSPVVSLKAGISSQYHFEEYPEEGIYRRYHLNIEKDREFVVEIPDNYHLASDSTTYNQLFLEFIPYWERIEAWNKIITIQGPFVGKNIGVFIEKLAEYLSLQSPPIMAGTQTMRELGVRTYVYTSKYRSFFPTKSADYEHLKLKAVDSPLGIWLVQYTYKYRKNWSKEIKELLLRRMDDFFEGTYVVDLTPPPPLPEPVDEEETEEPQENVDQQEGSN